MNLKSLVYIVFILLGLCPAAKAGVQEQAKFYEVDMDMKIPPITELRKKYIENNKVYNRNYEFYWNIGNVFNDVFRLTIGTYGASEKRMKPADEDAMIEMIQLLPSEYYQYIGPYLHTVPTISEKILNMPGIKETKNKFPTRIAPHLKDIEDLEFVSPYLYFILMPEAWPEYYENLDLPPKPIPPKPKVKRDDKLFARVNELVPEEEFLPNNSSKKIGKADLRTISPTKNSLLTKADIKAFGNTINKVNDFGASLERKAQLYEATSLLDIWEQDNGIGMPVNGLKDIVNPCQRLVQKVKIAGLEREFKKAIVSEGFSVKEWAWTCDKTIKALRLSNISRSMVVSIRTFERNLYDSYMQNLSDNQKMMQYQAMKSVIEMYRAPIEDVLAVRENRKELKDKFNAIKNRMATAPIYF